MTYHWCYRVWNSSRDPAGQSGEKTAKGVRRKEGPQALASPLHPGQQPLPGGNQEALPAPGRRELREREPGPQRQGGGQEGGSNQGGSNQGGGHRCQQMNMNVTLKIGSESLLVLGQVIKSHYLPTISALIVQCHT